MPTKKRKLRVAIIGAGARTGGAHYPTLKNIADVIAIADSDRDHLQTTANKLGIASRYTDYENMLKKEKPDIAYVIQLPQNTYDIAATVIESKCNLILKEPPGITLEQTRQLALLAKKHGVLTGVPFFRRFSPIVRQGKTLCEQKGRIHTAVATFYKHAVNGKPYYRGAADILYCDVIHAIDTLRYLCGGDVERVVSDVRRLNATYRNAHTALVKFSSGATGVLLTNWQAGCRRFSVEIHSPGASFFGNPETGGQFFENNQTTPSQTLTPQNAASKPDTPTTYGIYDINHHFINCIQKNELSETNFEDAFKTMELAEMIFHSQL